MSVDLIQLTVTKQKRPLLDSGWTVELDPELKCYEEGPDGTPVRVYGSEMEKMLTTENHYEKDYTIRA